MKKNSTELAFILDKSGSMHGLEKDTIGGFNSMLDKQKAAEGECRVTTVLFDSSCTVLHDRIDIAAVRPMTDEDYCAGGSTALLDAVGTTIDKIRNVQKNSAEEGRAEKVLFVIITDGMENSSREYSLRNVRSMIEEQRKNGWEFVFLGANIDAVEMNFCAVADAVSDYREMGCLKCECLSKVREYHRKRSGRKSSD